MDAQLVILGKVIIAFLFGGVLGFERGESGKPAGMRTHMLIAGSAALFVALGTVITQHIRVPEDIGSVRTDPLTIIEAVVVGVSFVAGGMIIQQKEEQKVYNLTTASSLMMAAGIGIAVGLEQYILATGITVLLLIVNRGIFAVEKWLGRRGIDVTQTTE